MRVTTYNNNYIDEIKNEISNLLLSKFDSEECFWDFSLQLAKVLGTKGYITFSEFKEVVSEIRKLVPASVEYINEYGYVDPFSRNQDFYIINMVETISEIESVKIFLTILFYYFKLYIHSGDYNYNSMSQFYSGISKALDFYSTSKTNIRNDLKFIRDINYILEGSEINSSKNSEMFRISVIISMLKYNSSIASDLIDENDFVFNFIINSGVKLFRIPDYHYLSSFDKYFNITHDNIQLVSQYYKDNHEDHLNFVIGTFHRLLTSNLEVLLENNCKISIASAYNIFNTFSNEQLTSSTTISKMVNFIKNDISTFIFVNIFTNRKLPIPDTLYNHILMLVNNVKHEWYSIVEVNYILKGQKMDWFTWVPSLHLLSSDPLEMVLESLISLYQQNQTNSKFISIIFYLLNIIYDVPANYKIKVVEPYLHLFKDEFLSKSNDLHVNSLSLPFWAYVSHLCTPYQLGTIFRKSLQNNLGSFKFMVESFKLSEHKRKGMVWKEIIARNFHYQNDIAEYISDSSDMNAKYALLEVMFEEPEEFLFKNSEHNVNIIVGLLESLKINDKRKFNKLIKEITLLPQINFILQDKEGNFSPILIYLPDSGVNNEVEFSPTNTTNYFVFEEIIKFLILDRQSTTKWKVDLSTISKKVFRICSFIFNNYPINSLDIRQTIQHIGSQYCLFKSTPLHLNNYELKYIPKELITSCLENLESLSHHFEIKHEIDIQLVRCKNLKSITIIQSKPKGKAIEDNEIENMVMENVSTFNFSSRGVFNQLGEVTEEAEQSLPDYGIDCKHFMKLFLDHYYNDKLESIHYDCTDKSFADVYQTIPILSMFQQNNPHVHVDITNRCYENYASLTSQEAKTLTDLHLIKSFEISRENPSIPWQFQIESMNGVKYFKINYKTNTHDKNQYSKLLENLNEMINQISSKENLKSIHFLDITIDHNGDRYSLFNSYNINVYDIDFKQFKPILESGNSIRKFYC